ncbi:MAG TPA: PadR family transcriptional regulator [Thermoanaerobaculia bacterium]|nr:PadR family transcriptional regulator [Thermoanaerobaculia bacterium]
MRHAPLLSDLEIQLLGLIREEARSGYALRKVLEASPGAVYPALRRLAAGGLIEGRVEGAGGRRKETFRVTGAGRRALREGLANPSLEELRRDPQGVAARLRFLEGAAAAAFLAEYARLSAHCASELKGQPGLAAQHDAALYSARSRWAAAAAKRLTVRSG